MAGAVDDSTINIVEVIIIIIIIIPLTFEPARVRLDSASIQYAISPGNTFEYYAELAVSSPAVAEP